MYNGTCPDLLILYLVPYAQTNLLGYPKSCVSCSAFWNLCSIYLTLHPKLMNPFLFLFGKHPESYDSICKKRSTAAITCCHVVSYLSLFCITLSFSTFYSGSGWLLSFVYSNKLCNLLHNAFSRFLIYGVSNNEHSSNSYGTPSSLSYCQTSITSVVLQLIKSWCYLLISWWMNFKTQLSSPQRLSYVLARVH